MTKLLKKRKKRNPQDTTLRNTRAANKKIEDLEIRVHRLEELFLKISDILKNL